MSGFDWTSHPAVTDLGGWYLVNDPAGRGTWKVLRANGGWVAKGHQPMWLAITDPTGQLAVFDSEQDAIAAILGHLTHDEVLAALRANRPEAQR